MLHASGVEWLFPNECARIYLILLVPEVGILGRCGSLAFKKSLQRKKLSERIKATKLGAFSELASKGF